MTGRIFAIVVMGGLCVALPASSAPTTIDKMPSIFRLEISQCSHGAQTRFGTAFAVQGFRSSQTKVVLVTALHVVHGCADVRVYSIDCQARTLKEAEQQNYRMMLDERDKVEIWPAHDLAVLPVRDLKALGLSKVEAKIDFSPGALDELQKRNQIIDYSLSGTSDRDLCLQWIAVNHVSLEQAGLRYEYLAKMMQAKADADPRTKDNRPVSAGSLRGALSTSAWTLAYSGQISHGASGSPVLLHPNMVVAIHIAGYTDQQLGWGIVMAGSQIDTTAPQAAYIDRWPPVAESSLEQSSPGSIVDRSGALKKYASRVRRAQNYLGASFGAGLQGRYVTDGPSTFSLRTSYAIHPRVRYTSRGYFKIGFAADAVVSVSRLDRRYFSPTGELLEAPGIDVWSAYAAPGLDLRLDRMSDWFSPSLSVGVLAGRWFYGEELPVRDNVTHLDLGTWASIKNRSPLWCYSRGRGVQCLHWVAALTATWQMTPTFDYTYVGVGGDYVRSGDAFTRHYAIEAGFEW